MSTDRGSRETPNLVFSHNDVKPNSYGKLLINSRKWLKAKLRITVLSQLATFLKDSIVGAIETAFPNNGGGLKMESHRILDFSGSNDDWPTWKSKTMCVLTGGDYGSCLRDKDYGKRHPKKNRMLFSLLASATINGTANHIVQDFEATSDGAGAWDALCTWFDRDVLLMETAKNIQDKLRHLKL